MPNLPHNEEHMEAWLCSHYWVLDENKAARQAKTLEEAVSFFGTIVAQNEAGPVIVSTVFLVIDHNHSRHGAPKLFETAIVSKEDCDIVERYSTWEEAVKGHAYHLEKAKKEYGNDN